MLNDRLLECHRRYLCLSWYVQGTAHAPGWCRNLFTMKTQPGISSPIGPLLWGQSSSISGGGRPRISSFQWEPHTDVFAFYCSSSLQTNKTIQSAFFVLIAKIIIVIKSELREAFFSLFFPPFFFIFFKVPPRFCSFLSSLNEWIWWCCWGWEKFGHNSSNHTHISTSVQGQCGQFCLLRWLPSLSDFFPP